MRALSMAPGVAAHVPVASTPAPPGHATRFIVSAAVDLPVASSARRHSDGITLYNFFGLNVQIQADLLHGQQRPARASASSGHSYSSVAALVVVAVARPPRRRRRARRSWAPLTPSSCSASSTITTSGRGAVGLVVLELSLRRLARSHSGAPDLRHHVSHALGQSDTSACRTPDPRVVPWKPACWHILHQARQATPGWGRYRGYERTALLDSVAGAL